MKPKPQFSVCLLLLAALFLGGPALAQRHALILCNQNYQHVGPLKTPLAEARAAEQTLAALGFAGNVTVVTDASTAKMTEVVDAFAARLKDAEVALFFYGGHAIQAAGENYLLGVDSDPATTSQLAYKALPLGRVLTNLEDSGGRLNLLILDCCRDNPLPTRGRNVGSTRGLAPIATAPKGTFIAYAADANQQAWDDHGQIGLYGTILFAKMKTPGLRLEDIFIQTREEVVKIAAENYQHQQEPTEISKISGAFYFLPIGSVSLDISASAPAAQSVNFSTTQSRPSPFHTIQKAQAKLKAVGLYNGQIDGLLGNESQAGIVKWQKQNNLSPTGALDKQTLMSLGVTNVIENDISKQPAQSSFNRKLDGPELDPHRATPPPTPQKSDDFSITEFLRKAAELRKK